VRSRSRVRLEPLGAPVWLDTGDTGKRTFAPRHSPSTSLIERIERALVLAAYVVVRHGPVYAPLVDRLERELEAARRNDPSERAKRILEVYATDGALIRSEAVAGGPTHDQSRCKSSRSRRPARAKHKRE
jgi:hypothetical protein